MVIIVIFIVTMSIIISEVYSFVADKRTSFAIRIVVIIFILRSVIYNINI